MNTELYSYEDLALVESFVELQRELDERLDHTPHLSTEHKYLLLCERCQLRPSAAFLSFLRAHEAEGVDVASTPLVSRTFAGSGSATLSTASLREVAPAAAADGHLSFERECIGPAALLPILVALPACSSYLRSLDLSRCNLSSVAVQLLCLKALPACTQLARLDISWNPLCGSLGVEALLQLVKRRPNITECDIRGLHAIAPLCRRLEDAVRRNRAAASASPCTLPKHPNDAPAVSS